VSGDAVAGVYGFRIAGIQNRRDLLIEAQPDWPLLEVTVRVGKVDQRITVVSEQYAELKLIEGVTARLDRSPPRVEFVTPTPISTRAIVHPFLSGVMPVQCHWMGRTALHGGAFTHKGRAWALLAGREGGKSTLLAHLAAQGVPILADDLVALEGDTTFAGPRSVDLRTEPTKETGPAESLGKVGARERWRISLGPILAEVPLGGFFFLEWSDKCEVRRLPGVERLRRIAAGRSLMLPLEDPMSLPRLSAFPGWLVQRPRQIGALPVTAEQIFQAVTA